MARYQNGSGKTLLTEAKIVCTQNSQVAALVFPERKTVLTGDWIPLANNPAAIETLTSVIGYLLDVSSPSPLERYRAVVQTALDLFKSLRDEDIPDDLWDKLRPSVNRLYDALQRFYGPWGALAGL